MNESFLSIAQEKQDRIRNEAMFEFGENGYEKASTNQIVKRAGIGKGMLFHYFNSKYDLYVYLIDFALKKIQDDYLNFSRTEPDFIERLKVFASDKWRFMQRHPELATFISSVFVNDSDIIPSDYQKQIKLLINQRMESLFAEIDLSLFREDIDINHALKLVHWTFDGYQADVIKRLKGKSMVHESWETYWEEFDHYLITLKTVFYKEDAQ